MAALLTTKKVNVMIKNNHTIETMAESLGVSVEDLDEELRRLYHEKSYNDVIRRLKSNSKIHKSKKTESEVEPEAESEVITSNEPLYDPNICQEDKEAEALDAIVQQIDEKNVEIGSLERKHQACLSKRNSLKGRLLSAKQELQNIQKRINQLQNQIEENMAEYLEEGEKMKSYTASKKALLDDLDVLEAKRIQLETISIMVYSNGVIEADNIEITDIPDQWKDVHQKFYGEDVLDTLTGFHQKILAKVFAFIQTLQKHYEICFEVNEMQVAFDTLKGGFVS